MALTAKLQTIREELAEARTAAESVRAEEAASGAVAAQARREIAQLGGTPTAAAPAPATKAIGRDRNRSPPNVPSTGSGWVMVANSFFTFSREFFKFSYTPTQRESRSSHCFGRNA